MTEPKSFSFQTRCRCKAGCGNRRCVCVKERRPCSEDCLCSDCQNPFNGVDVTQLSSCALDNIEAYKALTEDDLNTRLVLPCCCEEVPLGKLLKRYQCTKCHGEYWYSFCWNQVVEDSCTWHCDECRACRDWREWHCSVCNRCTYGISSPCMNCHEEEWDRSV